MASEHEAWKSIMEDGIRGIFPGIEKLVVSIDGECYPPDAKLSCLIKGMKNMKLDELLLEYDDRKLLIVKYEYGKAIVAAYYGDGIASTDLSRIIRLMFTRSGYRTCDKAFVPAACIETLIGRWERKIAPIFGKEFALKLVERSLKGKAKEAMTGDDLEEARSFISSALGDCLYLDKVNK